MKNLYQKAAVASVGFGSIVPAFAAVDLTQITGAFTHGDVTTGVLAVGFVLATIAVTIKGAKIVLAMIRG